MRVVSRANPSPRSRAGPLRRVRKPPPLPTTRIESCSRTNASTREAAEQGTDRFEANYGAKYPKAIASLRRDQDRLLTFFDFPAEHWKHIRTSNPIESTFATVRLRQRVTKGPGSRIRGLTMAFKLIQMAQDRWRRLNASHLLPLVRAGVPFTDGEQVEREDTDERKAAA